VRIFKTKWFVRFARQEDLDDAKLIEVVQNIEDGLVDADYGGGMIKQRIARDSGGKSGGYRGIIAFKSETRSIFVFAFSKSDKNNLTKAEVTAYKEAAAIYLKMTEAEIDLAVEKEVLTEVEYDVKRI
jgi:hypothetical protein